MKHRLIRRPGIPTVILALLVSVASEAPAAVSSVREKGKAPQEVAASSSAKPALPYAEYVRLVSRRGVVGHGHARKKTAKTAKATRNAKKGDKERGSEKVVATPVVATPVAAPAMAVEPKRPGGWRPDIAEVQRVLGTTRDLSGANLRRMNLTGLDLRNVILVNADLYLANLAGARLDGANLRGASLEMANLRGASLKEAKLSGAGLFMTSLEGANLEGADLTAVYAVGANLRGAVLAGANLRGGLFTRAVMERGDQRGEPVLAGGAGMVARAKATRDATLPDALGQAAFLKF